MAMTEHVDDPAAAAEALSPEDPLDKAVAEPDEVPEGAVNFQITESEIANVLSEQSLEVGSPSSCVFISAFIIPSGACLQSPSVLRNGSSVCRTSYNDAIGREWRRQRLTLSNRKDPASQA